MTCGPELRAEDDAPVGEGGGGVHGGWDEVAAASTSVSFSGLLLPLVFLAITVRYECNSSKLLSIPRYAFGTRNANNGLSY
jgi:hypothetical protein